MLEIRLKLWQDFEEELGWLDPHFFCVPIWLKNFATEYAKNYRRGTSGKGSDTK